MTQTPDVDFVETCFTGKTDFIIIQFLVTSCGIPKEQ
jgi:hypothetical protein